MPPGVGREKTELLCVMRPREDGIVTELPVGAKEATIA